MPDFAFLISYEGKKHTIYRDYGKGCIHRMFIIFNTQHNCPYCQGNHMTLTLDSVTLTYNFMDVMKNSPWPFLAPLNKNIPDMWTGK